MSCRNCELATSWPFYVCVVCCVFEITVWAYQTSKTKAKLRDFKTDENITKALQIIALFCCCCCCFSAFTLAICDSDILKSTVIDISFKEP